MGFSIYSRAEKYGRYEARNKNNFDEINKVFFYPPFSFTQQCQPKRMFFFIPFGWICHLPFWKFHFHSIRQNTSFTSFQVSLYYYSLTICVDISVLPFIICSKNFPNRHFHYNFCCCCIVIITPPFRRFFSIKFALLYIVFFIFLLCYPLLLSL